ncbi:MAG: metallophosphoesterase [Microbacteriaceae bacterium]|nr:metallophosphoesterase [Microbacteriaceae bacterium]
MGAGKRIGSAAAVAAAGAAVWAVAVERQLFTLRHHELPVLPTGRAPVRVLHLSDLHLAPWQRRKMRWVQDLAQLQPDVVVLTGDMLGHRDAIEPLLQTLKPLISGAAQTVFVHGSNDYYAPRLKNPASYLIEPSTKRKLKRQPDLDTAALTRGLVELGAVDLNNKAATGRVRGTDFLWFGMDDPHIKYHRPEQMRAAIAELAGQSAGDTDKPIAAKRAGDIGIAKTEPAGVDTAGTVAAPQTGAADSTEPVRLGVIHAPYQQPLNALVSEQPAVIFAGHTHGGQLRLPIAGALTSNCDLPTAQARGLSVWHTAHHQAFLHVCAGLGTSIYAPARFLCRPEAALITLVAPNSETT